MPSYSGAMSGCYYVRHISRDYQEWTRDEILFNPNTTPSPATALGLSPEIEAFHRQLPDYNTTPLHNLPSIAAELGISHLFLKDESSRFGLPAFKILGASWAIHRSLCQRFSLPASSSLDDVRAVLGKDIRLITCSEGNWGRAVARMGRILGMKVRVYVPGFMSSFTQDLLRGEGAEVVVLERGSYDDAIAATREEADRDVESALMVMDTSWEGYEEFPKWVTEGYGTMLSETDRQVAAYGVQPNTFLVSVGVGSWAQAVVARYQASGNRILAVEPTVAASFKESLHCGAPTPIETGETIMAGMCCGTTSLVAWPVLRDGIHAAVAVSDLESHHSVLELRALDVNAGPCGAATLAALRKYVAHVTEEEKRSMSVVLFSTEGSREYDIPVSI